jgi:hypothetical protein
MAEMAPIKRERVRFNNYSTSTCGLREKILQNKLFWRGIQCPNKMEDEFFSMVRVVGCKISKERKDREINLSS